MGNEQLQERFREIAPNIRAVGWTDCSHISTKEAEENESDYTKALSALSTAAEEAIEDRLRTVLKISILNGERKTEEAVKDMLNMGWKERWTLTDSVKGGDNIE